MKFAYLIIAHNEPYILNHLLEMLDYPQNDIYLLIDKKSTLIDVNDLYKSKHSTINLVDRINISWGGESQIKAEYQLIEAASSKFHDYYHLISGVDLPLMNQNTMASFFKKNYGKEFLGIIPNYTNDKDTAGRYEWWWLWEDSFGKSNKMTLKFLVSRLITKICKITDFQRTKHFHYHINYKNYYAGSSWWSLSQNAIDLLKSHKDWALKRFHNTSCCDEVFAQTIIANSSLKDSIYSLETNSCYNECLRYVRFNGSSPYNLNIDDYDKLVNSGCLFARKFSSQTINEKRLVDKIFEKYK